MMPKYNARPKYQPLPDLSDEEYEVLKADIALKGILYPVLQDEKGNTLAVSLRRTFLHV
jgi:hypothetical protein